MSKILIYSDLHIGATRVSLEKIKQTLEWINMTAKEKQVSAILNLGDTFDFYNHTKSKMKISPKQISELEDYGWLFNGHIIIRGNHEFHEEGDLLDVLKLFGAEIITEPKEWQTHEEPLTDNKYTKILLLPYDEKPTKKKYDVDYVFTHCDIKGAKFESGFTDDTEDSDILKNVKYKKLVLDGHYHIKQWARKDVYCVGATQSRVKSNNVEKMGIHILDTLTGNIEFIENPYAEYEVSETQRTYNYTFKEDSNIMEEIENFKLEKNGTEAFIEYLESKRGTYDNDLISYVIDFLKGGA